MVEIGVAHVAGAMLLFNPHDWRWRLDRKDSAIVTSAGVTGDADPSLAICRRCRDARS
jgi:hypothetical protein